VNKGAANLAKFVPGQTGSADDINRMFTETVPRRELKNRNLVDEAVELAPKLDDAKRSFNDGVKARFNELENVSLTTKDSLNDFLAGGDVVELLEDELLHVTQNKSFFAPQTRSLLENVTQIIDTGGPKESGLATYKKEFGEILVDSGKDEAAQTLRRRALNARRYVDDVMEHKNWENLGAGDKEVISNVRKTLDENLKTVFGVFIAVFAVSHIHNCLLSVLLTPNNNPIPSPFVFVPV
jgi:hypothetical protein